MTANRPVRPATSRALRDAVARSRRVPVASGPALPSREALLTTPTIDPGYAEDRHAHDQQDDDHGPPGHDLGLAHDLPTLVNRRRMLSLLGLGGAGVAALAACGTTAATTAAATSAATSAAGRGPGGGGTPPDQGSTVEVADGTIPEETGGPYPADGSNGVNVLIESGIVRSDITSSFGDASGVAEGVPLTIKLRVLDTANGSTGLSGAAVYLWHCDRNGDYSLYSDAIVDENYLRGVQEADSDGNVVFTSIFPAAYSGRWPHIHFEVYPSLDDATTAGSKLRTTQLALPEQACATVFATSGYEQSVSNLAQSSLDSDNVFSDGYSLQLATVTGSVSGGLTATLNVPV